MTEHIETAILCADGKRHDFIATARGSLAVTGQTSLTEWRRRADLQQCGPHTIRRRSVGEWLPIDEEQQTTPRVDDQPAAAWEGNGPCQDCGDRNVNWHAPNDVWNAVMGDHSGGGVGLLCVKCFVIRAETGGLKPPVWRLAPWHPEPDGEQQ